MTDDISPKIATILIYLPEIAILYQGGDNPGKYIQRGKNQ